MALLLSHVQAEVGVAARPDRAEVALSLLLPGAGRSTSTVLTPGQARELAAILYYEAGRADG